VSFYKGLLAEACKSETAWQGGVSGHPALGMIHVAVA